MITERALHNECLVIAQDLVLEARQAIAEGDHSFSLSDRIHQTVDGHEWVIYNGKAQAVCMAATFDDIGEAESNLRDMGCWDNGEYDFWRVQVLTAFQIMHNKVTEAVWDIDEKGELWS